MGHGPMAESIRFGDGCVRKMTCFFLARREFTALGAGRPFCFVCRVSFSAETPESMPYGDFCRAGSCFFLCAQTARTIRAAEAQVLGCRLPQIVRRTAKIRGGQLLRRRALTAAVRLFPGASGRRAGRGTLRGQAREIRGRGAAGKPGGGGGRLISGGGGSSR